jgi:hemerythrin-like metal-binding protein
MALINWDDSLSVKINSIDDQHKKLIAMINDFYDGISKRSSQESVLKLILEMKNYTVVHFTNEEKIMKQVNYPDFDSHKKLHEHFVAKVVELETKIKAGKLVVSLEITTFLKDWLKNHIMIVDKKYSDYFMRSGIK